LFIFKLASLVKIFVNKEFNVGTVDKIIIEFMQMANKGSVDHFLFACDLRTDKLGKCRPDFENIAELLPHQGLMLTSIYNTGTLGIFLSNYLGDIDFCDVRPT